MILLAIRRETIFRGKKAKKLLRGYLPMKIYPLLVVLAAMLSFSCTKNPDLQASQQSFPKAQINQTNLVSTNVKGQPYYKNQQVDFKAKYGKAIAYDWVINVVLGDGDVKSCEDGERINGTNSLIVVSLPLDVKSGTSYTLNGNIKSRTTKDGVFYNPLFPDGFASDPFEIYTIYIYEADKNHIHGWISAKSQVGSYQPDQGSVEGEFNVPFCKD